MKCKHGTSVLKCESCVLGVLIKCEESIKKKSCFANAFITPGTCTVSGSTGTTGATGTIGTPPFGYSASATHLIGTFTSDQLTAGTTTSILCRPLPITGTVLQLGACKSPLGWGLSVERDSAVGPYAYVQTPKCCSGCYSFNLSASVTLTGNVGALTIALSLLGLPVISVTPGLETSLPFTFDLSLCEVRQETQCTNRTVSLSRRTICHIQDAPCASTTFSPPTTFGLTLLTIDLGDIVIPPIDLPPIELPPIVLPPIVIPPIEIDVPLVGPVVIVVPPIDIPPIVIPPIDIPPIVIPPISLPSIPLILPIPTFTPGIHPINLSTNGIICLKECSKLVPCITIRGVQATQLISLLGIEVSLIGGPFNLRVTCLSLSLKKLKYDPCQNECDCDYQNPTGRSCGSSACSFGTCR